jgi:nucleoside-diphosphate-sugar epimerase
MTLVDALSPDRDPDLVARFAPWAGRRLLVFGAGYIGGAVARVARAAGLEVSALTRNPATAGALAAAGVDVVVADLASHDWHARMPRDADFVLNAVSSGGGGVEGYRRSYVEGARSLIAWASTASPPVRAHLIYTSSTSVYAQGGGVRVDETSDAEPVEENGRLILESERVVRGWLGPWTILRLAGIYGPERHLLLDQLRAGATELAGRGEHRLNLVHRDDVIGALVAVWRGRERAAGQVYTLADGCPEAKATVAAWVASRLGREPPGFSAEGAGLRRRQVPDRVIASDRIQRELGWRPRYPSFREGYAALLEA